MHCRGNGTTDARILCRGREEYPGGLGWYVGDDAVVKFWVSVNATAERTGGRRVDAGTDDVPVTVTAGSGPGDTTLLAGLVVVTAVVLAAGWWWLRRWEYRVPPRRDSPLLGDDLADPVVVRLDESAV